MPVRVVFVDAVTGRDVPGVRWRARSGPVPKEPTKVVVDAFWHTAGDTAVLPFPFDGIEVAAPQGRVSLRPRVIPCWPVARARSGVLTVPLFPEARVFVTLPADAPDEGFSLASTMVGTVREARIAGTTIPVRASSDTRGPQGLRGIPYLPGEELRLITAWDAGPAGRGTWCGTGTDRADSGIHFETEWIGRLRIGDNLPVLAEIPRDGQTRTSDLEDERREEETPWTSLHATRPDDDESPAGPLDPTARGAVRVRLLDRTGGPAAGVRVALRTTHLRTDAEGRATFTRFPSGEVGVRVIDSGWAFPKTRVVVQTDAIVDVEVRELSGGTLDVRVVDPDGQPVPCASLAFGREDGRFTWDLDDAGVQRLDALVGADGRRVFAHVPPGTVHVRASVGTREGRSRVEVTDGGTHVVTVTLPRRPR